MICQYFVIFRWEINNLIIHNVDSLEKKKNNNTIQLVNQLKLIQKITFFVTISTTSKNPCTQNWTQNLNHFQ